MNLYRTETPPPIKKKIDKMPGHLRQRARRDIKGLGNNPHPPGSKELKDLPGRYRVHLDGWRIIYLLNEEDKIVTILDIMRKTGPETYEGLDNEEQE